MPQSDKPNTFNCWIRIYKLIIDHSKFTGGLKQPQFWIRESIQVNTIPSESEFEDYGTQSRRHAAVESAYELKHAPRASRLGNGHVSLTTTHKLFLNVSQQVISGHSHPQDSIAMSMNGGVPYQSQAGMTPSSPEKPFFQPRHSPEAGAIKPGI